MARLRHLLVITLICLIWGCAQAGDGKGRADHGESQRLAQHPLVDAWESGAAVVVAIHVVPDESDETYGDFAYYLNQFQSDVQASTEPRWTFYSHPPLKAGDSPLPLDIRVTVQPYSVLFIYKGVTAHGHGEGYLYQGPVLEPQVYQFIEHRFSGRSMPLDLQQFSPKPVAVKHDPGTGKIIIQ